MPRSCAVQPCLKTQAFGSMSAIGTGVGGTGSDGGAGVGAPVGGVAKHVKPLANAINNYCLKKCDFFFETLKWETNTCRWYTKWICFSL